MRKSIEDSIQMELIRWCRTQPNELLHNIFHVPNGGKRDQITAVIMKRIGVKAGIPDLLLPLPNGKIYWLEMKTKKGRLSDVQKEVHEYLINLGHKVEIAYGLLDAIEKLKGIINEH